MSQKSSVPQAVNSLSQVLMSDNLPVTSYLAVPVISRSGEVFGGLFFGHEKEGVFSDECEIIVSGIAAQAAVALDNAKLYESARSEIEERQRIEAHQNILLAELSHRVKNTLAIVQSMVTQTLRYTKSPDQFKDSFIDRLSALSAGHSLLIDNNWTGASLHEILGKVLEPLSGNSPRYHLEGPEIILTPQDAVAAVLLFHELSTNCVKYGAWSVASGKVLISWSPWEKRPEVAVVKWQEMDGPQVSNPTHRGLGLALIERAVAEPYSGSISYMQGGLKCVFGLRTLTPQSQNTTKGSFWYSHA